MTDVPDDIPRLLIQLSRELPEKNTRGGQSLRMVRLVYYDCLWTVEADDCHGEGPSAEAAIVDCFNAINELKVNSQ